MTKKHFQALAEALRITRPEPPDDSESTLAQWRLDRHMIANTCAESNPRFDRARFTDWTER